MRGISYLKLRYATCRPSHGSGYRVCLVVCRGNLCPAHVVSALGPKLTENGHFYHLNTRVTTQCANSPFYSI